MAAGRGGSAVDWETIARGMLDGVTEFDIPAGVDIKSADYQFYGRAGLLSVVLPTGLSTVSKFMFQNCSKLKTVEFSNTITSIRDRAFQGAALESLNLPSTITSIGMYSFGSCKFVSVTIPSSVTTIGNYAFASCAQLVEVICEPTTPPTAGGINLFTWDNNLNAIYVPDASVATYKAASGWSTYANLIKGISERPT